MNRTRAYLFLLMGFFFLLCCGCFGTGPMKERIHHYTLEYTAPEMAWEMSLPYVLKVERFSVDPVFDTSRIIYKKDSFRRDEYVYHRWRTNPADMVTHLLMRDIKSSGLFRAVLQGESRLQPTHILEGTLEEFLEMEGGRSREAVLKACITLAEDNKKESSRRIILQETYVAKADCERETPTALVRAMSRAMSQISSSIIRDLHSRLTDPAKKE